MLHSLPTPSIQMHTPICADIMSYYKKKKSPRQNLPIRQANGIDNCTLSTNPSDAQRVAVAKSAGGFQGIHSSVQRDAPQDMISQH